MDLKTRAQNIVTRPAVEWPIIAGESTGVAELMTGYAAPLAAIPAVCGFLGLLVLGLGFGILRGLSGVIVSYVFGLVGLYIAAIIIEKLAPTFQSRGNTTQALKVVAYSMTPVWIAGVLHLVPALAMLTLIASLYAIYLFYLGLPQVMHTPENQVIPYMLVSALVVIVVTVCVGFVAAAIGGVALYGV
jgi:hypothetical protein